MTTDQRQGIACGGVWVLDTVKVIDHYRPKIPSPTSARCQRAVRARAQRRDRPRSLIRRCPPRPRPDWERSLRRLPRRPLPPLPNINLDQLRRTDEAGTSYTDVFSVKGSGAGLLSLQGNETGSTTRATGDQPAPGQMFHLGYLLLMDAMDEPDAEFALLPRVCSRSFRTGGFGHRSIWSRKTAIALPRLFRRR